MKNLEMDKSLPEKKLTEEEILQKYGDTEITVRSRAGNASMGVPSKETGREYKITVKEAMDNWDGTHWAAENEHVKINFDEDRGHTITLKPAE